MLAIAEPNEPRQNSLLYHALYLLQVAGGFVFQILLMRYFGASVETDSYFVSATIVSFVSILPGFFTDQFLQFYNDVKVQQGPESATQFYYSVWFLSVALGVAIGVVLWLLAHEVIFLFVPGFTGEALGACTEYLLVLNCSIPFSRVVLLNNALLNAEMRFSLPYLVGCITPVLNIAALVLGWRSGINVIAVSIVASQFLALLIQQSYISRVLGLRFRGTLWHDAIHQLVKNSFTMRIGHQIYSLREPVTANLLSHFPVGTISLYSFAYKLVSTLYSLTNSPIIQVFSAKTSFLVAHGQMTELRLRLRQVMLRSTLYFLALVVPAVFTIRFLVSIFFGGRFNTEELSAIAVFFQSFVPLHLVLAVEAPLVAIVVAMKRSLDVIRIAIINILIYTVCALLTVRLGGGLWLLPIAMGFAQVPNLLLYRRSVVAAFSAIQVGVTSATIGSSPDLKGG